MEGPVALIVQDQTRDLERRIGVMFLHLALAAFVRRLLDGQPVPLGCLGHALLKPVLIHGQEHGGTRLVTDSILIGGSPQAEWTDQLAVTLQDLVSSGIKQWTCPAFVPPQVLV